MSETPGADSAGKPWWMRGLRWTDTRDLGWRMGMAALFLVSLAGLLGGLKIPQAAPVLRMKLSTAASSSPSTPPALPFATGFIALSADMARVSNAAVPIETVTEFASPFRVSALIGPARQRAVDCLAAAGWYEAGDDPRGERAVVQVVLNRVRHPAFPKTVCGVVFQDAARSNACQFTFACDGSLGTRLPNADAWARARAIALAALGGAVDREVGLATHYHADYVVPRWRDSMVKMAQVGAHLFYRWPGYWGAAPAFGATEQGDGEPRIVDLARLSVAHVDPLPEDTAPSLPGQSEPVPAIPVNAAPSPPTVAARQALSEAVHAPRAPSVPSHNGTDRIDMLLDPGAYSGSYAVRAYALCKDKPRCAVYGRTGTDSPLGFLFLRDTRKGIETALWNCEQTPRTEHAQCLPQGAAVERLITEW
ncbi:cell wall hydrolase, SleB [Novosphingobium nitrogenifigens DSM 19370]|uniref:Cell wall hydrolase, SleB n=1 Tax=Novosphingobium nitrogenifigens DSM 19370 TaxID=983920 RepID=F1Z8H9_9SPHN|nr:cell wall hydrolase, SleB [Novosphingobium nitrogenifigens DSM 19370]